LDYAANSQNIEIKQEHDGWKDATKVENANAAEYGHATKAKDIAEQEQN
jgi:hypothetical protein